MLKFLFEKSFSVTSAMPLIFSGESLSEGSVIGFIIWGLVAVSIMTFESNLAKRNNW